MNPANGCLGSAERADQEPHCHWLQCCMRDLCQRSCGPKPFCKHCCRRGANESSPVHRTSFHCGAIWMGLSASQIYTARSSETSKNRQVSKCIARSGERQTRELQTSK